jgi:type II secretory pathway component GspD/PulD (secretin)
MKTRQFVLFAACVVAMMASLAADLVVIELKNRTADDILPALRPMVSRDVALSGMNYKLLVRGNATEVSQVRELVTVLDRAPQQWLISVRYNGSPERSSRAAGANATIDNQSAELTLRGGNTVRTGSDSSISSIRVSEGQSAHISSGQTIPIVTAFIPTQVSGRGTGVGIATDYRELSTGFRVLPRVNGQQVFLEIAAHQQREQPGSINSGSTEQRVATTISGRVGEWIDLGGVTSSSSRTESRVGTVGGSRRVTTMSDQRSIAVKVDPVQ